MTHALTTNISKTYQAAIFVTEESSKPSSIGKEASDILSSSPISPSSPATKKIPSLSEGTKEVTLVSSLTEGSTRESDIILSSLLLTETIASPTSDTTTHSLKNLSRKTNNLTQRGLPKKQVLEFSEIDSTQSSDFETPPPAYDGLELWLEKNGLELAGSPSEEPPPAYDGLELWLEKNGLELAGSPSEESPPAYNSLETDETPPAYRSNIYKTFPVRVGEKGEKTIQVLKMVPTQYLELSDTISADNITNSLNKIKNVYDIAYIENGVVKTMGPLQYRKDKDGHKFLTESLQKQNLQLNNREKVNILFPQDYVSFGLIGERDNLTKQLDRVIFQLKNRPTKSSMSEEALRAMDKHITLLSEAAKKREDRYLGQEQHVQITTQFPTPEKITEMNIATRKNMLKRATKLKEKIMTQHQAQLDLSAKKTTETTDSTWELSENQYTKGLLISEPGKEPKEVLILSYEKDKSLKLPNKSARKIEKSFNKYNNRITLVYANPINNEIHIAKVQYDNGMLHKEGHKNVKKVEDKDTMLHQLAKNARLSEPERI